MQAVLAEQAQAAHLAKIKDAHKDFDVLVPKIPEWIKTQPAILQPRLQQVYEAGDTQSVIDLFTMYKDSTGMNKPAESAEVIAAREAKEEAAKKARDEAQSMTPVKSSRTVTAPRAGAPDPNDFEGAFKEAAELAEAKK